MIIWIWIGFLVFIFFMLALDLGVFNRKAHFIGIKEAIGWTSLWVVLALVFNVLIYFMYENHWLGIGREFGHVLSGKEAALQFLTGYIIEKSLSLDNIFVIALIFAFFKVPDMYQHRVLFWGILGAILMRGFMILTGVALVSRFVWMDYVFGALLIFTAIKMILSQEENLEPDKNPLVKLARRFYPVSKTFVGQHFFTRTEEGKRAITPLFVTLIVIESTDVLFAFDSIPAIFAITRDPFLIFTSNIFAILGLRSMYFFLAAMMEKFRYIKFSLVFVLVYVGIKMLLSHHYTIPMGVTLGIIGLFLLSGILSSVYSNHRRNNHKLLASGEGGNGAPKRILKKKQVDTPH